jgi:hypothetical protein
LIWVSEKLWYLPLSCKKPKFKLAAIYCRNFKPKIFADITMPDSKLYSPHTGKLYATFDFAIDSV